MKKGTAGKLVRSLLRMKEDENFLGFKILGADKTYSTMYEVKVSDGDVLVQATDEDFVLVTYNLKNGSEYCLAKGFIGNFLFDFERKKFPVLSEKDLSAKLSLLTATFAAGWKFNEPETIIRNNEYMLCIIDETNVCGFFMSMDGKYIKGSEGGHTLCEGLWSEYSEYFEEE